VFASAVADAFVDIAPTFDRKLHARLAHASQASDPHALRTGWQRRFAAIGAPAGLQVAEPFTILDLS
jgi:LmbE family N-acetylglucosaminyl deacetylase